MGSRLFLGHGTRFQEGLTSNCNSVTFRLVTRPTKVRNIVQVAALAIRSGYVLYTSHANIRMRERRIIKPEVEHILTHGHHEAKKDQFNDEFRSWDYAIKGKTLDGRTLRIIIAVVDPNILVITTIDLDAKED